MVDIYDLIQPGSDAESHTKSLHQNISQNLTEITGKAVSLDNIVPIENQTPMIPEDNLASGEQSKKASLWEKILKWFKISDQNNVDLEDIIAGNMGRPRTEPSNVFLIEHKKRLSAKHPGMEIVEVNKK